MINVKRVTCILVSFRHNLYDFTSPVFDIHKVLMPSDIRSFFGGKGNQESSQEQVAKKKNVSRSLFLYCVYMGGNCSHKKIVFITIIHTVEVIYEFQTLHITRCFTYIVLG